MMCADVYWQKSGARFSFLIDGAVACKFHNVSINVFIAFQASDWLTLKFRIYQPSSRPIAKSTTNLLVLYMAPWRCGMTLHGAVALWYDTRLTCGRCRVRPSLGAELFTEISFAHINFCVV